MASRLILIRHGDTGEAFRGRFLGSTDAPLSERGLLQANRLSARGIIESGGSCYSSPMTRVLQTSDATGMTARIDPDLREIDFGRWDGLTFDEIKSADPAEVDRWAEWDRDFAFPGGERTGDFVDRVRRVGARMASDPSETVVAFTHGGVIRTLICYYLGIDARNYLLFDIDYASITTLRLFDGKGVLIGLNDLCHLEGM